jgi:XisH protein
MTQTPLYRPHNPHPSQMWSELVWEAQKDRQKIAVEIKSFLRASKITDFYQAFGQFLPYKVALKRVEPDRTIYLAIPTSTYEELFREILIQDLLEEYPVKLIVYNSEKEEIQSWID